MDKNHYVIIMAGGIGSRFWPMSRTNLPKQFLDILGRKKTLIQETYARFVSFIPKENIYIVTNQKYAELVQAQLPRFNKSQILLEPMGKNTAPCVAYASYKIRKQNPDAVFVVAASDHLIANEKQFRKDIEHGLNACQNEDIIMTLGIKPTRPDTGYGYIQYLDDEENRGHFKVKTFVEKPKLEMAKIFLESGDFVWNSGIFLFSATTISLAFEKYLPEMAASFAGIEDVYYTDNEASVIKTTYATCQSISIDYGIMEKVNNVYVIPTEFGWSDLGTWGSVYQNSDKDYLGNATNGNIMIYEANNNVINIQNGKKLVVVKGLEDFIVVDTDDVLLICKKEEEQSIRDIVNDVKNSQGDIFN
ncbi:MAG: mannose-1-phosphate guanylyltransferase [Bacteroidia bacterium]